MHNPAFRHLCGVCSVDELVLGSGPAKHPVQLSNPQTLLEMLLNLLLDQVLDDGLASRFRPIHGVLIGVLP